MKNKTNLNKHNKEYMKGYYEKNREKIGLDRKEFYKNNKDYLKKYRKNKKSWLTDASKKWAELHKEEKAERDKARIESLNDSIIKAYIKKQTGLDLEDITPEMIEIKRLQITLKRLIK